MKTKHEKKSLRDCFLSRIAALEAEGKYSTAANYTSAMRSFMTFIGDDSFRIGSLDRSVVEKYNVYLYGRGVVRNTVSFYNRILRAVWNRAVRDGFSDGDQAFSDVYTGVDTTVKRSLPLSVLRALVSIDTGDDEELTLSKDLFLFSFYARGMSFVDLAYLTRDNIADGRLGYIRRKTGQFLVIGMEPCMKLIIKKYDGMCFDRYLFPIITSNDRLTAHKQYVYKLRRHNLRLKELGRLCGAGDHLNSYATRHSWATVAQESGISLSVISSGLGHSSEKTTRIYLDTLSQHHVDKANQRILNKVLSVGELSY